MDADKPELAADFLLIKLPLSKKVAAKGRMAFLA